MKLFYAPQSPFARKVRIAAIELSLEERLEFIYTEVVPGEPNRAYGSRHNPLRKIPALLTEEGATIYDSTVICEYLDSLTEAGSLVPPSGRRRWRVLTNHALAQGMCESAILLRYETWLRPAPLRWPDWIADHWDKIDAGLDWFDRHAEELGGRPDLAQIALGCLLGYLDFRWPGDDWRDMASPLADQPGESRRGGDESVGSGLPLAGWRARYRGLAEWFDIIEQRPSFAKTEPYAPPIL